MEKCDYCFVYNDLEDSCVICDRNYCKKCFNKWHKMIKINKCKKFINNMCQVQMCIECAYLDKKAPVFNNLYEIEYNIKLKYDNIQWYKKDCIKDLQNILYNYNKINNPIKLFLNICKKLEKFNIFNEFIYQIYKEIKNEILFKREIIQQNIFLLIKKIQN